MHRAALAIYTGFQNHHLSAPCVSRPYTYMAPMFTHFAVGPHLPLAAPVEMAQRRGGQEYVRRYIEMLGISSVTRIHTLLVDPTPKIVWRGEAAIDDEVEQLARELKRGHLLLVYERAYDDDGVAYCGDFVLALLPF